MHKPLIAAKLIILALGLLIAWTAYRGYRRHQSMSMWYLAIGFALISVGTVTEGLLFEHFEVEIFLASAIQSFISATGMLAILYSLYGDHTRPVLDDAT